MSARVLIALLTLVFPFVAGNAAELDRHERLIRDVDSLFSGDALNPHAEDARQARIMFESMFGAMPAVVEVGDRELGRLYDSIRLVVVVSVNGGLSEAEDRSLLQMLEQVVIELDRRKLAREEHFEGLYRAAIQSRAFDVIERLASDPRWNFYERLVLAPEIASRSGRASVLKVLENGSLTRSEIDLTLPLQIVVVAHQRCRYAKAAAAQIFVSTELAAVFQRYATWVSPPRGEIDVAGVDAWNSLYPFAPIGLVERLEYWSPIPDMRPSPTIYLLKNGQVMSRFDGWDDETANSLMRLLDGESQDSVGS
jgi:hypothetical protein